MASNIDPLFPAAGSATTQSVRVNFEAAKTEIEDLQNDRAYGSDLDSHIADAANPHGVTAAQIGAAEVAHISDYQNVHRQQRVVTGTDYTSDLSSLTDIPALTFSLEGGVTYAYDFWIIFKSQTTGNGILLTLYAANATTLLFHTRTPTGLIAWNNVNVRANNGGIASSTIDVADTSTLVTLTGVVKCSAASSLVVRFRPETATLWAKVLAGSCGVCTMMPPQL